MPKLIDRRELTQGEAFPGEERPGPDQYRESFAVKDFQWKSVHDDDDVLVRISGMASTPEVDSFNEIVNPEAFRESLPQFMERPITLFAHVWRSVPIGRVTKAEIRADGLFVEIEIFATALGVDVALLIKKKLLRSLSIGFQLLKIEVSVEDDEPSVITNLRLLEISVVAVPANESSNFEVNGILSAAESQGVMCKSLSDLIKPTPRKDKRMEPEVKEALKRAENRLGEVKTAFDDFVMTSGEREKAALAFHKRVEESIEQAKKFQDGTITAGEFKTFGEKIIGEMETLRTDLEKGRSAELHRKTRFHMKDWRDALGTKWLKRDDGTPYTELQIKAHTLFHAPVDYKSHPEGEMLRQMRELHDHVALMEAYSRGKNQGPIHNLKSFQDLASIVGYFDPEFGKAMSSGTAALGGDFVPTQLSAEVVELLRLRPALINRLDTFDMPSNPFDWPLLTSGATAYIADEADVNNPPEGTKSDLGVSKVTFNAKIFATHIRTSPELIEDSIVAMVPLLRTEIVRSIDEGIEAALVNGDTTVPHRDVGPAYAAGSVQRAFLGLRYQSIDDSTTFDTRSTSAGVGDALAGFGAGDVRYLRKLADVAGVDPSLGLFIVNIAVWFLMLSFTEVTKANEFGNPSTWLTGTLPALDGVEIYVSSKMPTTELSTGVDNSGTSSSILFIRKPSFKVGSRRNVMIEFDKNIFTQQWGFVATTRRDFKKVAVSTDKPVTRGLDINTP